MSPPAPMVGVVIRLPEFGLLQMRPQTWLEYAAIPPLVEAVRGAAHSPFSFPDKELPQHAASLMQRGDKIASRKRAADNAGHIRSHGMHQEIVRGIRPLAFNLADASRHRDRTDAG